MAEAKRAPRIIQSFSYSQEDILLDILYLLGLTEFEADVTYGNGSFYKKAVPEPLLKFDLQPLFPDVVESDSGSLPLDDSSMRSIIFDPPFLTYIRAGRNGNGSMLLAKAYAGYWRYDELVDHYRSTLKEASRVLTPGGFLVMKCQDIVHNHALHPTHMYAVQWAEEAGLRLKDMFVLGAKTRLPSPNRKGTQKHARIHHSYFLVFENGTLRERKW